MGVLELLVDGGDDGFEAFLVECLGDVDGDIEAWELPEAQIFVCCGVVEAQLEVDGGVGGAVISVYGVPVDIQGESQEPELGYPAVVVPDRGGLVVVEGFPGEF